MKLIEQARQFADQAEVYSIRRKVVHVRFRESALELVANRDTTACALRVIRSGRLGASFAGALEKPELLEDAVAAASFGQQVPFGFAPVQAYPNIVSPSPSIEGLAADDLIELEIDVRNRILGAAPDAVVNLSCKAEAGERRVRTTEGADASSPFARVSLSVELPFATRGTDVGSFDRLVTTGLMEIPDAWIEELLEVRSWGTGPSVPDSGRMPVLLAPYVSNLLTLTLAACLGSGAVAQGASPLAEKLGERVLSERLTIHEDPLCAGLPFARSFDDEGVAVQPRAIVERGVLRSFLTDLSGAADLGQSPSGNALRRTMFSERIEDAPAPSWLGAIIETGEDSWRDLMAGIGEGILVTRMAGLHSSNLLQGQYAVQASGFHIRNGKPIGYLERTMMAGNVFEDFLNIRGVSREREATAQAEMEVAGLAPYILLDAAQVTVG